ncbi:hypothetical protein B0T24DRAFT_614271, partial [Lasiosphaeria ovina]
MGWAWLAGLAGLAVPLSLLVRSILYVCMYLRSGNAYVYQSHPLQPRLFPACSSMQPASQPASQPPPPSQQLSIPTL